MHELNEASPELAELFSFDNVALAVTDIERSADWYGKVLGFKRGYRTYIESMQADFLILERADLKIELLSRAGTRRHPDAEIVPGPHVDQTGAKAIVFRTTDLAALTAHFERHQARFEWKMKRLSDDGLMATMIRDPDGIIINVLCYPAPGA
ncbi:MULTISPECIES: VOC family protein [Burkholderia]|jgi:catechol 2,3-dioxygenase-like lactoylglutathione lyase family enzyme|uniref:VOC family protein n=1 Tax=Burkholderia TaxID=32008 RepID=UPI00050E2659|nr:MULTISPECIES: VOC family protein [Burkholderia]KGE08032.1 glyoxalase/bleomycin resistance protein/dioxygenase [Burkholderia gladioli]KVM72662.1 bleomycin resistance protein [Burkholderia gladioli]NBI50437.1 VOC family protein [Burkholderia sp. ISTR5]